MEGSSRSLSGVLAAALLAGNSGCITFTPHYSLVDLNRPRGLFETAAREGVGSSILAVVAIPLILAPLGWLLYRRQRSQQRAIIASGGSDQAHEAEKAIKTTVEEPACLP
jgi:hypothetical protein